MRLLGVIIVAIASVILLKGEALAHTSGRDGGQAHSNTGKQPEAVAPSTYASECRGLVATSSATMVDRPSGMGRRASTNDRDARDNWDPYDDCCGVACHPALGSKGDDRLASHPPSGPVVIADISELRGTRQGRLERPPRRP